MQKEEVINKLLEQAQHLSFSVTAIEGFRKDATQSRLALDSTNKAIAEIAKTLEK